MLTGVRKTPGPLVFKISTVSHVGKACSTCYNLFATSVEIFYDVDAVLGTVNPHAMKVIVLCIPLIVIRDIL